MQIVQMPIDELIPYKNNPRNNKNAIEKVAESIESFGFKVPLVIDKDNVIVAGHTRWLAAKELGYKDVPCIVADDLNDGQIKAFRLADNKVSEFSEWDEEKLEMELSELMLLVDMDMTAFGFDEIVKEAEELMEDDEESNTESSFNYKEQYGVIVMCSDEQEQQAIYERLVEEGFECKVVTT